MRDGIAIVGMAGLFPGAPDLAAYWQNIRAGVDAIGEVPPERWDPAFYPEPIYCRRGGFVDEHARFDPAAHGVMPVAARGAEPDQLLALDLAARALADAGYADRPFAREKAGVILGRGGYAGVGRTRLADQVRGAEQVIRALRAQGLDEAALAAVRAELARPAGDPIGLVPNLAASRIANRLDLGGPAFTIDAACASALVAVDQACVELASGRSDLVLTGGVHLCQDEVFWTVFCQLGALSRSQQIRPFDRRADGLLIGEGLGLVVLKRLADALRDDDRVYAVIRGTGMASDGRAASLMSPRVEGQVLALTRAWRDAGLDPATVGLIEAHGTGTPAGDAAELETLRRVFGGPPAAAVLGSVKSMIGHTMPAAGAAGLIKAALAIHHGELPPTLHCEEPHPALAETRFRTLSRPEPWEGPRRAGVNAFGFGGIDAHVVLEEPPGGRRSRRPAAAPVDERLLCLAAPTPAALLEELARPFTRDKDREIVRRGEGPVRVALLDPTPARIARAREIVERGQPWRGREGIWHAPRALLADGGKLAFVYPGLDSSFRPRVEDVAARFGLPLPEPLAPAGIEELGVAIIQVDRLMGRVLAACGLRPDVILGHSIGEWSGMIAAGMIPDATVEAFIDSARGGTLEVPGVAFAAAGCGAERAAAALDGLPDIALSHDNCPHQVILCGADASIDAAVARLSGAGVLCQRLPFRSGFHSPVFAPLVGPHRENFARLPLLPARVPLFSSTICAEYPSDPEAIRALAVRHLIEPVRFRELILALHERGARVFVQVGTGSLPGFIEDTLRGRPHAALAANLPARAGLEQLARLLAALFVEGAEPDLGRLAPAPRGEKLALGAPLIELKTRLTPAPPPPPAGRVEGALRDVLDEIARASREVAAGPSRPREVRTVRTLSVDTLPELLDHTFFRQPPGWPVLSDRHPVVPMTTLIELMLESARALVPGKVAVAVEEVQALRWLVVSTPVAAAFHARFDGRDAVAVSIDGYASATVRFADGYPAPPAPPPPLAGAPAPIAAARLYEDRWMFHGPAYRGIALLGPIGERGIAGTIATGAAKGALLDNAGQLFGYWVMLTNEVDRLAMPLRIERLRLFGPHPSPGERLACTVHIREQGPRDVIADLWLVGRAGVWAQIEGWQDRRFETDARLWPVMIHPEKNLLAEPRPEGFVLFDDHYRGAATRDQLARRFLGERERADYEAQGPRGQRAWLNGRIAGKDAVRDHLFRRGRASLYPVEVELSNDADGRPRARVAGADLRISIAHKGDLAVARVAEGREVGIDIERIEPRSPGFARTAFHDDELALTDGSDEWLTRLWSAKEAAGKQRGTGLGGNPLRLRVTDRAGERLLVDGLWVETCREDKHIIAWTTP